MVKRLLILLLLLITLTASAQSEHTPMMPDGTLRRINVPILMYHYVGDLPEDADEIRTELTLSTVFFRQHLAFLQSRGYQTVTLDDIYHALIIGQSLPPKPIVLTFDDGYTDHYENVFPVLQEFGYIGTFFIITTPLDQQNPAYLTWEQAVVMSQAGMEIAPHTKTHQDLRNRDYNFLVYEILGSWESIVAYTGQRPTAFSYPAGRYDEMTLDVTAQAPVALAVTTQSGRLHTTDDLLELPRLRISSTMGALGLSAILGEPPP